MPPENLYGDTWDILEGEYIIDVNGERHNGPADNVRVMRVDNKEGTTDFEIQGWGDRKVCVTGDSFRSVVQKEE